MATRIRAPLILAALLAVLGVCGRPLAASAATPAPVTISGLDLHDGVILHYHSTWYMYGTEYACGFTWGTAGTPFCGFGVSTAPAITGPWSRPKLLFSPAAVVHNTGWPGDAGQTWTWVCGAGGAGCFNPRMVRRTDGVWILWFNAPGDWVRHHVNAYWAMGCNGPAGPCGSQAGGPHGSTHKPAMTDCNDNGDFSIVTAPGRLPVILCSMSGAISEEQIAPGWVDGDATGTKDIPGLSGEGVGAAEVPGGTWITVYSAPGCGYCSGTASAAGVVSVHAGYATAPTLLGPWTPRGYLSPAPCLGQPRTVAAGYEWVDEWTGSPNETAAKVLLEPMTADPWSCS